MRAGRSLFHFQPHDDEPHLWRIAEPTARPQLLGLRVYARSESSAIALWVRWMSRRGRSVMVTSVGR